MKIMPVMKVRDLDIAARFYAEVLGFTPVWPVYEAQERANGVLALTLEGAELQLSHHAGDGAFGSLSRVWVEDIDARYAHFKLYGLDTDGRPESPVHTAPVDQTWGLREFAVTDPDGNTLLFCQPIRSA